MEFSRIFPFNKERRSETVLKIKRATMGYFWYQMQGLPISEIFFKTFQLNF